MLSHPIKIDTVVRIYIVKKSIENFGNRYRFSLSLNYY